MLDQKLLTKDPEFVLDAVKKRGKGYLEYFENAKNLQIQWKEAKNEIDGLKHEQKTKSKGMRGLQGDDALNLRNELKVFSDNIKEKQQSLNIIEEQRQEVLLHLPNIPAENLPIGGEENNEEISTFGTPKPFDFEPKPHWDLGIDLNILDFEKAAIMSGSRFSILKGAGAKLERALTQFMLDLHSDAGYTEISPPVLVKKDAMILTGQIPHLEEDTYKVGDEDPYYLIPTSEVVLVNTYANEIIEVSQLPVQLVAATNCFRSEAGSYGRDVRGLVRQHQFLKVELVKITKPENSYEELDKLRLNAEEILKLLKLPYRVLLLATGDMGFQAAKTYDLEVWLPSEGKYKEISSCSNCTDFQARRGKIRFRRKQGEKPELCHTINGSGLAVGRTLLAVLENYQNEDGTITIPEVLRPYLRNKTKITKNGLE
jgi:seryl-tRNA synthetase